MDAVDRLIALALEEDIGSGDVTSAAVVPASLVGVAEIVAKEPLVVAGVEAARRVFLAVDPNLRVEVLRPDGTRASPGDVVLRAEGSGRALLAAERTALNFLQRLCGIATATARAVRQLEGTRARLLDTRKTAPGFRALEKAAVRAGGGLNHRAGLYDAMLVKDNHVAAAGSVGEATRRAIRAAPPGMKVEVEVKSIAEVDEALAAGATDLLLDNMDLATLRAAVARIGGRARTEASGGVTIENLRAVAEAGVDFVSMGALTHSSPAADLSMALTWKQP